MILKAISAIFLTLLMFVSSTNAARLNLSSSKWVHVSEEQPIDEFLREFFASQKIIVSLNKSISGETVSGRFNEPPQQVFDKITAAFKLLWYYDGNILYIGRSDEAVTKIINLKKIGTERLKKMLNDMDVPDPRYPLRYYPKEKVVYVTGHKRYIELVQEAVKALESQVADVKDDNKPSQRMTAPNKSTYQKNISIKMVGNKAYVRSGPSIKNPILGTITSAKAHLNVLGRYKGWLFVHSSAANVYGWVEAAPVQSLP